MEWLYVILVSICAIVSYATSNEIRSLVLGLEIGLSIGQLIHFLIVITKR